MRALLHPASKASTLTDLALLVPRVALGVSLLAHGCQNLIEYTATGTAAPFEQMGVPAPTAAAAAMFAIAAEILGGAALILGSLSPVVALHSTVNLFGALVLVHAGNGVFIENGGYELVLALAAGLVVIARLVAGRFSVDGLLGRCYSVGHAAPGCTTATAAA